MPNNDTTLCACVWSSRSTLVVADVWRVLHSCGGLTAVIGFIRKISRATRFVGDMPRFDFFVEQDKSDEVFTVIYTNESKHFYLFLRVFKVSN